MIDLRSDTVTQPSPAMRDAMASAKVGDDVFGEDPTVNALQEAVAHMLGHEAGLFVPSGTMGNQLAIKTHTRPANEIIIEADAHIFKYECGASSMISGVMTKTLHGQRGILTASQIAVAINGPDIHNAPTGMIALENTHNRAGGTIYPIETVKQISDLARQRQIPLHLDGARLMNACVASHIKPQTYGVLFDSVSLCLSKGLGAPVGSVLVGNKPFIAHARYYRKALGGGMRQAGILAAAGLYALQHHVNDLADDHRKAQILAETLSALPPFEIDVTTVQTNIVIFDVVNPALDAQRVVDHLGSQGILAIPFGERKVRFVTHRDLTFEQIDEAVSILRKQYQ